MPTEWKLPPMRPGGPSDADTEARRAAMNAAIEASDPQHPELPHIARREAKIGITTCWEIGDAAAASTVVMYLHGGGFSLGDPRMWRRYAARIVQDAGVFMALVKYRLAPENPFPAALYDVVSAYQELCDRYPDKKIVVMGESAGASLTATIAVAALQNGARLPDALIMISPLLDLRVANPAYDSHAAVDKMVSRESNTLIRRNYLQGHPETDPLVSPVLGDLGQFPPVQFHCGGNEVLIGDATDFVTKMALAGGLVESHFVPGAGHGWTFTQPQSAAAKYTMGHILRYLRELPTRTD
jgi:epsilon-lactone hydrolase